MYTTLLVSAIIFLNKCYIIDYVAGVRKYIFYDTNLEGIVIGRK